MISCVTLILFIMNGTDLISEELCESVDCEEIVEDDQEWMYTNTGNLIGNLSVTAEKLRKLREELNGQTLNITFMDDYPLSYTVIENGTTKAKGVAFELLEFLTEKLNFTYELVRPEKNIMGSSDQYNGSILEMLDTQVIINYFRGYFS